MRARVEKRSVLGWNKSETDFGKCKGTYAEDIQIQAIEGRGRFVFIRVERTHRRRQHKTISNTKIGLLPNTSWQGHTKSYPATKWK